MCFFGGGGGPVVYSPQVSAPPPQLEKSSAEKQAASEDERLKLGYSQRGLAATIITGGLGDVSPQQTKGVILGGK